MPSEAAKVTRVKLSAFPQWCVCERSSQHWFDLHKDGSVVCGFDASLVDRH